MATEVHAPKTYTCPKCGKVHAADLSAMEGHPEIHGKVHCMQCHELLWLSLADDGSTKVELYEEHLHGEAHAAQSAAKAAETPTRTPASSEAPADAKPSSFAPILIAAVVAAAVSFLVGMASGSTKGGDEAAGTGTNTQLDALKTDLEGVRADIAAASAAQEKLKSEVHAALSAGTDAATGQQKALAAIQASLDEMNARLGKTEECYKGLNGRIELNYTNARAADKRLRALEGK